MAAIGQKRPQSANPALVQSSNMSDRNEQGR